MFIGNRKFFHGGLMAGSVLLLGVLGPGTACAEGLSIGAGVLVEQMPYHSYDRVVSPMPVINYENQYFFVRGLSAGVYALNTENHSLYAQLSYFPNQFEASKTDDYTLKQLDRRRSSVMAGIGYEHRADWGNVYTQVKIDVSGRSDGVVADVAYGYPFRLGRLYLEPQIGVQWQSRQYNNYYYGVSREESGRSGLMHYSAESGSTPYLAVNANYSLNEHWLVFFIGRYIRLSTAVKDSPMTSRSSTGWVGAGIMYRF